MTNTGWAGLGLTFLTLCACSTGTGTTDAGASDGGSDAGAGVDAGGALDAAADTSGDVDGSVDVMLVAAVPLGGIPIALAGDDAADRVYVSLAVDGAAETGAGIAVVDTTADVVVATLPAPTVSDNPPGPMHPELTLLAVDAAHHRLYAAADAEPRVFIYDTSTNMLVDHVDPFGTIPTSPVPVNGIALDETAGVLYVDAGGLFAVDTTSLAVTSISGLTIHSIPFFHRQSLALDTTNHLLFHAGRDASSAIAVETIDTSTQMVTTSAAEFMDASTLVGCAGVPGFAAAVTTQTAGGAVLRALEPVDVPLPTDFNASAYSLSLISPGNIIVTLVGDRGGIPWIFQRRFMGETPVGAFDVSVRLAMPFETVTGLTDAHATYIGNHVSLTVTAGGTGGSGGSTVEPTILHLIFNDPSWF